MITPALPLKVGKIWFYTSKQVDDVASNRGWINMIVTEIPLLIMCGNICNDINDSRLYTSVRK